MEIKKEYSMDEFERMVIGRTPERPGIAIEERSTLPVMLKIEDETCFDRAREMCEDVVEDSQVFLFVNEAGAAFELPEFPPSFERCVNLYDRKAREKMKEKLGEHVARNFLAVHVGGITLALLVDVNEKNVEDVKELRKRREAEEMK